MNVAVIPARGGSKRIPQKNIKNFFGKPIIAYSIETALESRLFQKVIVSTDDPEIKEVAESYGADVPFKRPSTISNDFATTGEVMAHATNWLIKNTNSLTSVCCIYATAPFIRVKDLLEAYQLFKISKKYFVFSATKFSFPIQRALRRKTDGGIEMLQPKHFNSRSQDLEEAYHDAGQFYFGKPNAWINNEVLFTDNSEIFYLPNWRVQDIDNKDDWKRTELLFKMINQQV